MPINNFSVGKDVTLNLVTQVGVVSFSIRTSFRSKQLIKKIESHGMDGVPRFINIPAGWEGSFRFDRANANLDKFVAQQEALYFAGSPILPSSITETIAEPDGSLSQFLFQAVVLEYDDAGEIKGDDIVKQTLAFRASARIQLQ